MKRCRDTIQFNDWVELIKKEIRKKQRNPDEDDDEGDGIQHEIKKAVQEIKNELTKFPLIRSEKLDEPD